MKKVFVGILAVCLIICGLNMRADVDRLDPYSVTSEGGCVRADTHISAQTALSRLGGTVLWTEEVDGVTVTYAYSDFVRGYETVRGMRVNIMIAERAEYTAVGMPLLTGSY